MKTSAEYVASVRGLPRTVFLLGEQVADATAHPILRPSLNALAETYRPAENEDAGALLVAAFLLGLLVKMVTRLQRGLWAQVRSQRGF